MFLSGAAGAQAASPWSVVASPSGSASGALDAVAAVSASNVWAVGGADGSPLIEHWNGSSWTIASAAPVTDGYLSFVSAPAANDVWAAGGQDGYAPLIEHYDGQSWSVLPTLPSKAVQLVGLSALSPKNVWVGASGYSFHSQTVFLDHWNGVKWSQHRVDIASPEDGAWPISVTAFSNKNVWIAHAYEPHDDDTRYTTDRWTGSGFTSAGYWYIGSEGPPPQVNAMAASSPSDVWQAGMWSGFADGSTQWQSDAATGHFDGTSWTSSDTTPYPACCHEFNAIAPASPTNVWAVGSRWDDTVSGAPVYNLLEHWNGSAWAEYGGPNLTTQNSLSGVGSVPGSSTFWAVGATGTAPQRTLILRCC